MKKLSRSSSHSDSPTKKVPKTSERDSPIRKRAGLNKKEKQSKKAEDRGQLTLMNMADGALSQRRSVSPSQYASKQQDDSSSPDAETIRGKSYVSDTSEELTDTEKDMIAPNLSVPEFKKILLDEEQAADPAFFMAAQTDMEARGIRAERKITNTIDEINRQLIEEINQISRTKSATSSASNFLALLAQKQYVGFGTAPPPSEYAFKIYIKGKYESSPNGQRISSYKGMPFFVLDRAKDYRKKWTNDMQTADKKNYDVTTPHVTNREEAKDLQEKTMLHWSHALGNANYGNETSLNTQLATMGKNVKGNDVIGQGEMQSEIERALTKIKNDMPKLPVFVKFTDYIDDQGRLHTRRYKIFCVAEDKTDQDKFDEILMGDIYMPGLIAMKRDNPLFQNFKLSVSGLSEMAKAVQSHINGNSTQSVKKRVHQWSQINDLAIRKRRGKTSHFTPENSKNYRDELFEDKLKQKSDAQQIHIKKSGETEKIADTAISEMIKNFVKIKVYKNEENLTEKLASLDLSKGALHTLEQCVNKKLLTKAEVKKIFTAILDSRFGTLRPNSELLEAAMIAYRKQK